MEQDITKKLYLNAIESQLFYLQQNPAEDQESLELLMKNIGYKVSKLTDSIQNDIHKIDQPGIKEPNQLPSIPQQHSYRQSLGLDKSNIVEEFQLSKSKSQRTLQLSKDFSGEVFYKQQRTQRKRYSESVSELIRNAKQEAFQPTQTSSKNLIDLKAYESSDLSQQSSLLDLRLARNNVVKQISKKLNVNIPHSLQSSSTNSKSISSNIGSVLSAQYQQQQQPANYNSMYLQSSINNQSQQHNMSMISQIDNTLINNSSMFANEDSIIQNLKGFSDNKQINDGIQGSANVKKRPFKLKLQEPRILPKELRENPFAVLPVVKEKDLQLGLFELVNKGFIPKDTDIEPAFQQGRSMIEAKKMNFNEIHPKQFKLETTSANISQSIIQRSKQEQYVYDSSVISKDNDFFITAGLNNDQKLHQSTLQQNEQNNISISEANLQNLIENSLKKTLNTSFLEDQEHIKKEEHDKYEVFMKGKRVIKLSILNGITQI